MNSTLKSRKARGFTIVELMVAMSIGLVLLGGLSLVFMNGSQSTAELQKSGQQMENGRYAVSILNDDLRHAGFYGDFGAIAGAPGTLPDPCETSPGTLTAAANLNY